MPHSTEQEDDDTAFNNFLFSGVIEGFNEDAPGEFDTTGKATDAQNFSDLDDDDLADDEDALPTQKSTVEPSKGAIDAELEDDGFDDLFGIDENPFPVQPETSRVGDAFQLDQDSDDVGEEAFPFDESNERELQVEDDEGEEDPEVREQQKLFEQARRNREARMQRGEFADMPPAPVTDDEVFSMVFPQFEVNKPPRFGELLPSKRAHYLYRTPLKPPKPLYMNKVNLEIEPDQEKLFKLPEQPIATLAVRRAEAQSKGLILCGDAEISQVADDEEDSPEIIDPNEKIGGLTWYDLVAVCTDWTIGGEDETSGEGLVQMEDSPDEDDGLDEFFNGPSNSHASKKAKLSHSRFDHPPLYDLPDTSWDDPVAATAKIAEKVVLDLNDPYLLIEYENPNDNTRKRKAGGTFKRDAVGGLTKDFFKRYNISNDEAYDLLKENHQSKVRSILGNVAIEHSLPAVKLQYPFYKTKLSAKEARTFHRPAFTTQPGGLVFFDKPAFVKRKHLKGRDAQSLFNKSKDLSIGDNSNVMLLEYSEEHPIMLSGFGMGNKLINYYRRKDNDDTSRPKLDIGETQVLLPQDKSPFSIFGDVERGQIMPTIHNGMYRAPVFKHEPASTDFLISRNWNHVEGASWYLRNIENLQLVGQEFPLVEVPGTHSRKVTDAAKRRLRMVSYRMWRNHKIVKNEMILDHLPNTDIASNRSKMREFMDYDKERQSWIPRKGEPIPEESELRGMVKPEDVCLLYSMQVGDRQLHDAGYNKDDMDVDADDDDEDTANIDKQLAPWQTTKNFLNACQGKAMLKLHGDGDPSGRGEAFNFIRTSMKGGFKEIGESIEDRLDAINKKKELGGHSYNVAKQQTAYNNAIKRIWDAQTRSLSSTVEHDVDMADAEDEAETSAPERNRTPNTGAGRGRPDDDSASMYSRGTSAADAGKILQITRKWIDKFGKEQVEVEVVRDPRVIREYQKRKRQQELNDMRLDQMKKTGDKEMDEQKEKMLQAELERLLRNKNRRMGRDKAKGITSAGSPDSSAASLAADADAVVPPSTGPTSKQRSTTVTMRKCANCGQVGHIKTNRKLADPPPPCPICFYDNDAFGSTRLGQQMEKENQKKKQHKRVHFADD